MNLSSLDGLRAGESGERGEARLESAASDGGRAGKSSPPEGPGETTRNLCERDSNREGVKE